MSEKTAIKIIILLVVAMSASLGFFHSCNNKFDIQDDNYAEEIIEEFINSEVGIRLDLTPASPEKDQTQPSYQ